MKSKRSLWQTITYHLNDSSPFMRTVGRIALLAELNICLLISSLPVFTAGAATIALHTTFLHLPSLSYGSALKTYFRTFAKVLRPALPLWLLTLAAGVALGAGWHTVFSTASTDQFFILLPLLLSSAVVLFTVIWLYPLFAVRLDADALLSTKTLLADAFLLGLRELPRSFAALFLLTLPAVLALWSTTSVTAVGLWMLFGISPFALCINLLLRPVFLPKTSA